ncbi:hypothetical protein GCM10008107_07160 [Psychrosphaera saromensis]|uniref:Lipoprotein n=1 Tax=Psychrosphaera saromensis TaxID=716813 RepID=A0A2S7UWL6_9GAMM|nr:hypothetical protein [Psychrosphaera saromensis]PQJ54376.1 hypothetical protein BTO11_12390 [Psychrosphaera saromensis]GHB60481.1 hypothetical protein GCM10008107_07160 [Psychrosphaera saromensis]GLQ14586.1 hypothetical protein GCM10007917_20410 [Psychrosphaera saromensis]
MRKHLVIMATLFLLSACGGTSRLEDTSNLGSISEPINPSENLAIPDNRNKLSYQILIIGNSHVSGIQSLLTTIFENNNEAKNVTIETRKGQFLDTIVNDGNITELINNQKWTHVILQGQKYSQSQMRLYPTDATILWIQRAKAVGATPILFPEHPPFGKLKEAEYVHNIHKEMATEQSSCVAPVGLTWNSTLSILPSLKLHSPDGNHASTLGATLTSFVLYETITGESADLLPFIDTLQGDETTQALFGQIASETITNNLPCQF